MPLTAALLLLVRKGGAVSLAASTTTCHTFHRHSCAFFTILFRAILSVARYFSFSVVSYERREQRRFYAFLFVLVQFEAIPSFTYLLSKHPLLSFLKGLWRQPTLFHLRELAFGNPLNFVQVPKDVVSRKGCSCCNKLSNFPLRDVGSDDLEQVVGLFYPRYDSSGVIKWNQRLQ